MSRKLADGRAAMPGGRARGGRILIASAALMLVAAALCAIGVIPVANPTRNILAGVLAVSGLIEGFIGLRFLGES